MATTVLRRIYLTDEQLFEVEQGLELRVEDLERLIERDPEDDEWPVKRQCASQTLEALQNGVPEEHYVHFRLEVAQHAALKRGIALRVAECRSMIEALELTGSGKAAIADHWRDQLAAALHLQQLVARS